MIKTLKRKFIVAAMIAVTVLLVALLGAVNVVNAWSTSRETDRLLEDLVQMENDAPPEFPDGEGPAFPEGEGPGFPEGEAPPLAARGGRRSPSGPGPLRGGRSPGWCSRR